jgi:hypothetical protein
MAVTKATTGRYNTLVGSLAEVKDALSTERVDPTKVLGFVWNGTNYTALFYR